MLYTTAFPDVNSMTDKRIAHKVAVINSRGKLYVYRDKINRPVNYLKKSKFTQNMWNAAAAVETYGAVGKGLRPKNNVTENIITVKHSPEKIQ